MQEAHNPRREVSRRSTCGDDDSMMLFTRIRERSRQAHEVSRVVRHKSAAIGSGEAKLCEVVGTEHPGIARQQHVNCLARTIAAAIALTSSSKYNRA